MHLPPADIHSLRTLANMLGQSISGLVAWLCAEELRRRKGRTDPPR